MPADAIHYMALSKELSNTLTGGRIDKIVMPDKSMLMLFIRNAGVTHNLLITAAAQPRCFLSAFKLSSAAVPNAFCVHLRKHIGGGIIRSIQAVPFERILVMEITSFGDLGEAREKKLYVELMGKYSNIIVTDGQDKISDALKHISADEGRPILPGFTFKLPPSAALMPDQTEEIRRLIETADGEDVERILMRNVRGIAPITAKEAVCRGGDVAANLLDIVNAAITPIVYYDGEPIDFSFCEYGCIAGERKKLDTISGAMDEYYNLRLASRSKIEGKNQLLRVLNVAIDKQKKKLASCTIDKVGADNFEEERILGELITANIYKFSGELKSAEVYDWYRSENRLISFNETTATTAAQKCFARYQKKKRTVEWLEKQIAEISVALDYYDSIVAAVENAENGDDLAEIEDEFRDAGIVKSTRTQKKADTSQPRRFDVGGFNLIVGKNNMQNDRITKAARGDDFWLHTQGIHGSHAVLQVRGHEPGIDILKKAAAFAAFFSKARLSQNVPVDYTKAKNVHKPKGAPPGKVEYVNQKTLFVNPLPPTDC